MSGAFAVNRNPHLQKLQKWVFIGLCLPLQVTNRLTPPAPQTEPAALQMYIIIPFQLPRRENHHKLTKLAGTKMTFERLALKMLFCLIFDYTLSISSFDKTVDLSHTDDTVSSHCINPDL